MHRLWQLLGLVALVMAPSVGLAQGSGAPSQGDLDAARALANTGFQLFDQGQYKKAIARFVSAEALYHAPPHVLFMARANAKLGRLLEARRLYRQLIAEKFDAKTPKPFRKAQKAGEAELVELDKRIPSVSITVRGDKAEQALVSVDGEVVGTDRLNAPLRLDPGKHRIQAKAAGWPEANASVTLREGGGTTSLSLTVGATESSVDSEQRPLPTEAPPDGDEPGGGSSVVGPIVLVGVGAAAMVVGAITGGLTLSTAAELKDTCPQNPCSDEHEHLKDSVHTLGTVSTVAFVVGGAAAGAGLLWLVLQPSDDSSEDVAAVRIEPYAGPLGWGVQGRF